MDSLAKARPLIDQAWELAYLDASRARDLGRRIIGLTEHEPLSEESAWGWLHLALAEARTGDAAVAADAATHARSVFERSASQRGLCLADEVLAILCRRRGDIAGCDALHRAVDARPDPGYTDHDRFIAQNSRAINAKLRGEPEETLRRFYRAHAAAVRTGWVGPRLLALGNLGGFHQDLFNLEDARTLTRAAFDAAREAGARETLATACANLIVIHFAAGQARAAREMADFMLDHRNEVPVSATARLRVPLALGFYASGDPEAAQGFLDLGPVAGVGDGDGKAFWAWVQAGVWLAGGDRERAREMTQSVIEDHQSRQTAAQPYDLMQLYRIAAEANEQLGDLASALSFTRRAHAAYEELVGRSARARFIALEVSHQIDAVRHARDEAENDRRRLEELNQKLHEQVEETRRLQVQLQEQALRDPLTALHNRRYLFEVAPRLLELAERQGSTLCVVLLDLDHFKSLNDSFGHQAGDEALKAFAELLQSRLRRTEAVCRHGGEEFVVVMPDVALAGAEAVLARLLEACQGLQLQHRGRALPRMSFSAGVAQYPRHGETLDQLLSRADRALYKAKDLGRSRIEVAQTTDFAMLQP